MKRFAISLPVVVAALAVGALVAGPLNAAETWDLAPYRITVLIAVDPAATPLRDLASELKADLPARAAAAMGGVWQLRVQIAPVELRQTMTDRIAEVERDQLPADALKLDKVILLAVSRAGSQTAVSARELDMATDLWNMVVTRHTSQPGQIPGEAFRAVAAAFAPLARIELAEKGAATLRLKAGAIAPRDRSAVQIATGTAFRPVLVACDADGAPTAGSVQPIAWTWLSATNPGRPTLTCRIDSGAAGEPIPDYHPRRLRLALAVAPPQASTRLLLSTAGREPAETSPLEGVEVLAQAPSAAVDAEPMGISDRWGSVEIPPAKDPAAGPVQMLLIRRGASQLARLPIVPGLERELKLVLPDDRQRLAIDTLLDEAEDGLVDLAARRQALAARIKLARQANESELADKLLQQLRALTSAESVTALFSQADKLLAASDPQTQTLVKPRLDGLRKLAQELAAESPQSLLDK
jgi:hypothetical protein